MDAPPCRVSRGLFSDRADQRTDPDGPVLASIPYKYLITAKPPIKRIMNTRHSRLKYLSMKGFTTGPNSQIRPATKKNRAERLIVEAIRKIRKLILNTPAVIVITL